MNIRTSRSTTHVTSPPKAAKVSRSRKIPFGLRFFLVFLIIPINTSPSRHHHRTAPLQDRQCLRSLQLSPTRLTFPSVNNFSLPNRIDLDRDNKMSDEASTQAAAIPPPVELEAARSETIVEPEVKEAESTNEPVANGSAEIIEPKEVATVDAPQESKNPYFSIA